MQFDLPMAHTAEMHRKQSINKWRLFGKPTINSIFYFSNILEYLLASRATR